MLWLTNGSFFCKLILKKFISRFNEKENVSGVVQAKSTVIKQIRAKLIEDYPHIEEYIDEILPKKENVRVAKWWEIFVGTCREMLHTFPYFFCSNWKIFSQDHIEILANSSGEPILFRSYDGPYIPVLRLLHKYPFILTPQQVDKGAIKFVLSGANIMCPGLTTPGGRITKCGKDKIVAIMAEGKQHALAIGITKMTTDEMYAHQIYAYRSSVFSPTQSCIILMICS